MQLLSPPSSFRNRNVFAIVASSPFTSIAFGLSWFTSTFMIYVFANGEQNVTLGNISGLATLITLVASLLGALISDRYRRDVVVYFSGVVLFVGAFIFTQADSIGDVFLAQSIQSLAFGMLGPAQNALIADSTIPAERNSTFGWMFAISNIAMAAGNIIGFFVFGTEEGLPSETTLRFSMKIAFWLMFVGMGFYLFVSDSHVISAGEDKVLGVENDSDSLGGFTRTGLIAVTIMIGSGMLIGFGAGLSIPFLQYFFFDIYSLDLGRLSLVFAVMMVITGVLGKVLADLGNRFGRVKMMALSQLVSVVLLYSLATYPPIAIAIVAILVRNAAMNATGPLSNALIVDHTPRNRRAMVLLVQSIAWTVLNGSAQVLGGRIIDRYGYWLAFVSTATIYLLATFLMLLIKEPSNGIASKEPKLSSDSSQ